MVRGGHPGGDLRRGSDANRASACGHPNAADSQPLGKGLSPLEATGFTMKRSLPFIYLGLNVACALVVLFAAHRVAGLVAAEQRGYSDSVDAVTFFAHSAPALVLALLANVAWAV